MYKRILLTLDGSEMSEQALPVAVELAKRFESELFLLRVIYPLAKSYRSGLASVSAIQKAEEQLRILAYDYLEKFTDELKKEGINTTIDSVIGVPYKEIILYTERQAIDLIVMCTRGESGISRWLLGSTTDHVIRGSRIPLIVIPAKEN
jgi:nucleotide-binding universal stress UspA family protein